MNRKMKNALATVRQLAALGLPAGVIMDDLLACLRDVTPFETATMVLLNDDYSGRDHLGNIEFPLEVSTRYVERWFNKEEVRIYPSHLRLQTDPALRVMRVSDFCPDLGQTEIYDEVLGRAEHHWIAGVTCRDGNRPIGNLGLGRPPGLPDFTKDDLRLLDMARPYISQALGVRTAPDEADSAGGDTTEVGLLFADLKGAVLTESANAARLLRWARGVPLDQGLTENELYAWARPLLIELAGRVQAALNGAVAAPAVLRSANAYGEFMLRAYALTPTSIDVTAGVGVQIERRLPMSVKLFRSPVFRGLPARERAVAQGLVAGQSQSEIAAEMGVQASTVISHTRNLYARLGVNTRQDLVGTLLAAG